MKTYTVEVDDNGDTFWYLNGYLHREDDAAIEYFGGGKRWFLYGEEFTAQEFLDRIANNTTTIN